MRKTVAIFGTLLIAAVLLISGSAVATWVYAIDNTSSNCMNPDYAENDPDGYDASLGEHVPPAEPVLGWILLDLGSVNAMPANQDFTVFADSSSNETYTVWVSETSDVEYKQYVGSGWDTEDLIFTTPSGSGTSWRYILICGTSGQPTPQDPLYGPDIDAVGWDK
jgi:hypothetical protein